MVSTRESMGSLLFYEEANKGGEGRLNSERNLSMLNDDDDSTDGT